MQPHWFAASKVYIQDLDRIHLFELRRRYIELIREADTHSDRELFNGILNEIDAELGHQGEERPWHSEIHPAQRQPQTYSVGVNLSATLAKDSSMPNKESDT